MAAASKASFYFFSTKALLLTSTFAASVLFFCADSVEFFLGALFFSTFG
jgi:hypothetical protein